MCEGGPSEKYFISLVSLRVRGNKKQRLFLRREGQGARGKFKQVN